MAPGPRFAIECQPLIRDLCSHLCCCILIHCSFCSLIHCFCCLVPCFVCCLLHCSLPCSAKKVGLPVFWALGPGPRAHGPSWPLNASRSFGMCVLMCYFVTFSFIVCLFYHSLFFQCRIHCFFVVLYGYFCCLIHYSLTWSTQNEHVPVFWALDPGPRAKMAIECQLRIGDLRSHSSSFCVLIHFFCLIICFLLLSHSWFFLLSHSLFFTLHVQPHRLHFPVFWGFIKEALLRKPYYRSLNKEALLKRTQGGLEALLRRP